MRKQRLESMRSAGGDLDIAAVGSLVSDPARCRMLLALSGGQSLPASRLAAEAEVGAPTASSHLAKLVNAGLLAVEQHGRRRYYQLAGPAVGNLIEALEQLAPEVPVRSLRQSHRARQLREARWCYDHLAGQVGVDMMAAMLKRGLLEGDDPGYAITDDGRAFLNGLGLDAAVAVRPVRHHLDSTEQRPHLMGALGRALLDQFVVRGWVRRADGRAAVVTPAGRLAFESEFEIRLSR